MTCHAVTCRAPLRARAAELGCLRMLLPCSRLMPCHAMPCCRPALLEALKRELPPKYTIKGEQIRLKPYRLAWLA